MDKVEPAKDGNSKTLTLKKTSPTEEKEMAAEDIANCWTSPRAAWRGRKSWTKRATPRPPTP